MKLSFTTLACPDWDLEQILNAAVKYGYDAVDFRHLRGSTALTTLPEFTARLADTARRIKEKNMQVSGISSGLCLFSPDAVKREQTVEESVAYVRLAAGLGAPYLRVFGGKLGGTPRPEALKAGGAVLRAMATVAAQEGVVIALESHDDWLRGAEVMGLLDAAGAGRSAGVLWDVLNSWMESDEPPEVTASCFTGHLVGTHWKDIDSRPSDPAHYCLPGQGRAPWRKFHELIRGMDYDGYYTLEWEKAWHPEIEEADVALPAFVKAMRAIESGT